MVGEIFQEASARSLYHLTSCGRTEKIWELSDGLSKENSFMRASVCGQRMEVPQGLPGYGVGFLGGGMILRARDRVYGLTTAAGIWVAAAIGMLVGAGYYLIAIVGTLIGIVTVVLFRRLEERLSVAKESGQQAMGRASDDD